MLEETMTFIQAQLHHQQIQEIGKAVYLKTVAGTFNRIVVPEIVDHSALLHWVYLLRSDGQTLHVRLRNEQIVYIM